MKRRGPLFWLVLGAFAGSGAWWALTVPRDLALLDRAIPANATFVSVHEDIASRWDEWARSPLTTALFHSIGLSTGDVRSVVDDPDTRRWV